MMDVVARVIVWLNAGANALGSVLLAPIAVLPGWLSATLVAAVTGVALLVAFKYTSRQQAIKAVRRDIKAHLLALRLFKDSTAVALRAQGRIFRGAARLALLAMVPMAVMLIPVCLFLGQLGLWYQSRPLLVGEEAVVTMKLNGAASAWPTVRLQPTDALAVTVGPVRVRSQREVCWYIQARQDGHQRMLFEVDGQSVDKELAVGDGFMRVSVLRPGWDWSEALLHPGETPFGPDGPVQSIRIDYPDRSSWTSGTRSWLVFWFTGSMIMALCFRRVLNVNI